MLAAVSKESQYFESLRDRIIVGNKRPPPEVPGAAVQPRLPNKPGDAVPGSKAKIPTSSQRPGKRTNDTIPYGRMAFTAFNESPADPSDMVPGDLMMVHKTTNDLGHDSNRASKSATWRQINAVLGKTHRAQSTVLAAASSYPTIAHARRALADAYETVLDHSKFEISRMKIVPQGVDQSFTDYYHKGYEDLCARLKDLATQVESKDPRTEFIPIIDWRGVRALRDWCPDGVLMSRDDDEQDASYYHAGGGDSGCMLNIAIQGPATVRNGLISRYSRDAAEFAQLLDPEPRIRDTMYLLLVCKQEFDEAVNITHLSFKYKTTSARIIEHWQELHDKKKDTGVSVQNPNIPWPVPESVSYEDLTMTVAMWKLGTVLDNRTATHPEVKFRMNVCVEEVPLFGLLTWWGGGMIASAAGSIRWPMFEDGGGGGGGGGISCPFDGALGVFDHVLGPIAS